MWHSNGNTCDLTNEKSFRLIVFIERNGNLILCWWPDSHSLAVTLFTCQHLNFIFVRWTWWVCHNRNSRNVEPFFGRSFKPQINKYNFLRILFAMHSMIIKIKFNDTYQNAPFKITRAVASEAQGALVFCVAVSWSRSDFTRADLLSLGSFPFLFPFSNPMLVSLSPVLWFHQIILLFVLVVSSPSPCFVKIYWSLHVYWHHIWS